jgi:hypothetical protein
MTDDEVTRDVDPHWLARLRERDDTERDDAERDADPHTDTGADADEHTIGNVDLLEQIRAAVRDARPDTAPAAPPTLGERLTPTSPSEAPPTISFPPPDPASPVHSAKAAPTVTSPEARWQPPARLKPITATTAPVLLTDSARPARSKRALMIAAAAAVVVALVVGVLIGRSASSDPKPGDDTTVSTPDGGTAVPTEATVASASTVGTDS